MFRKNMLHHALVRAITISTVGPASLFSASTFAQDGAYEQPVEELVSVGTRAKARSVTDSPAPVDVISSEEIVSQGGSDLSDLIRNVVPSYNVNDQPISDAATIVRPANLRGLSPDHTLVLVNGKRRHRASVITWLGNGISNGSQGPDIAAIPGIALKSVEVLRDGAAAQYGSDAIAGVMNFGLKDEAEGGSVELKGGIYSEGDGDQAALSVNKGFAIGSDGFLNVSGEFGFANDTNRSIQRDDAQSLIDAGYEEVPVPAMIWGTPLIEDDLKLWANYGFAITDGIELYGYANHNTKKVDGGFYYRNPTNRGGVYAGALYDSRTGLPIPAETLALDEEDFDIAVPEEFRRTSLLVGDTTGEGGCDDIPFEEDGITLSSSLDDLPSNCFTFQQTIPGGFTPRFGGDVTDQALLVGLQGEVDDFTWDVSYYYGYHESDFFINNTVNASYGPNTQRDFNPGAYAQEDQNLAADFTYLVSDMVSLAFGAEYRTEKFTITQGDEQSYTQGPLADQGFSTSSNGFPGFSPGNSGSWDRSNVAVYLDAEFDVSEDLLLTSALRFEEFDDFGSTTNLKLGGNYSVTDTAGFRATVSTGFKAPTPGQSNASNVSTSFVDGVLVNQGTIPASSAVAQAVGAEPLDAEKSVNVAYGGYFSAGPIDMTIDFFHVFVSDRLNLSAEQELTEEQAQILEDEGIDTSDIAQFRFFTNDFDTSTRGMDFIATADADLLGGSTTFTLNINYTKTEVTDSNPETVDDARIRQIEETTPDTRANFSAIHQLDSLRLLGRASYYGEFYDNEAGGVFDSAILFDIEAAYDFNESSAFALGVRNLFDERGCSIDDCSDGQSSGDLGLQYSQFSPFGFNGTFIYGRYSYSF